MFKWKTTQGLQEAEGILQEAGKKALEFCIYWKKGVFQEYMHMVMADTTNPQGVHFICQLYTGN